MREPTFIDPQVVFEAIELARLGQVPYERSHKVCKKTQNFVKKKLKAFPSRLNGFLYKTKLVLLLWTWSASLPLGETSGWSELLRDSTQCFFNYYGSFRRLSKGRKIESKVTQVHQAHQRIKRQQN